MICTPYPTSGRLVWRVSRRFRSYLVSFTSGSVLGVGLGAVADDMLVVGAIIAVVECTYGGGDAMS
jgi:hypothetical protein